ncbi:MAG: phage holin family protein [Synergistaceae bacterium]|nr:phage holin family protein [Synergistaceae bacterium]
MSWDTYLDTGFALLGGFLSWLYGGFDEALKVLLVMMVLDYVTGLLKGAYLKRWCSDIGFHGIARKVYMLIIVGITNIIGNEVFSQSEVWSGVPRDAVICFYIANEGLSILENAIEMDTPVPEKIKELFLSWHKKQLISKNKPDPDDE